jgi:glucose-6-phosphate 1-dehydrogenase
MAFQYEMKFGGDALPDAYERLLVDVLQGDASLFARSDEIELSWRIVDPILAGWEAGQPSLAFYEPGSWGPLEADDLLDGDGNCWLPGCAGA